MNRGHINHFSPEYAVLEDNERIVETAGFVPLDIKFKRFEQAGILQMLNKQKYSVDDLRDIYFGEDSEIHPYDELEDIVSKLQIQEQKKLKLAETVAERSEASVQASQSLDTEIVENKQYLKDKEEVNE